MKAGRTHLWTISSRRLWIFLHIATITRLGSMVMGEDVAVYPDGNDVHFLIHLSECNYLFLLDAKLNPIPLPSIAVIIPNDSSVEISKPKNSPPNLAPTNPNTTATAGLRYAKSSTAFARRVNKLRRFRIAHIFDVYTMKGSCGTKYTRGIAAWGTRVRSRYAPTAICFRALALTCSICQHTHKDGHDLGETALVDLETCSI